MDTGAATPLGCGLAASAPKVVYRGAGLCLPWCGPCRVQIFRVSIFLYPDSLPKNVSKQTLKTTTVYSLLLLLCLAVRMNAISNESLSPSWLCCQRAVGERDKDCRVSVRWAGAPKGQVIFFHELVSA